VSEEGNSGTKGVQFSVSLATASPLKATVAFATRDGSASAGADYVATSGTLSFGPGETKKSISVSVMGDTVFEPDETFVLELSGPVNASLGKSTATGTIKNEDVQKPKPGIYSGTTSQNRAITFFVSPDSTIVSLTRTAIDITCTEVPITVPNEPLVIPDQIPLGPDSRFSFTDSFSDSDGSISLRLDGGLALNGPASGTLRVDLALNLPMGVVHCSTGDVSWSASPPA
jgi:hypothetical protein